MKQQLVAIRHVISSIYINNPWFTTNCRIELICKPQTEKMFLC